ncbi:unnamed protein product [Brassica rapa subsp. trilocularis]
MELSNESEKIRQAPLNSSCLPKGEPSYCGSWWFLSFNDLSLTDFLDKFMEKKPKQNTWHSGSKIQPSKKDGYLNSVLAFTHTIGDCKLKTADSSSPLISDKRFNIVY